MCLERCVRIYPHLQDTGGFFVAVLQRTDKPPARDAFVSAPSSNVDSQAYNTDARVWYSPFEQYPGWAAVKKRYNLPPGLATSQLLVRNDSAKVVYYVNESLASLLLHDPLCALRHANCGLGVPAFQATQSGEEYHITQAGLHALLPLLSAPVLIRCTTADMRQVLEGLNQDRHVDRTVLSAKLQRSFDEAGPGGAALVPKQHGVDAVAVVVKQRKWVRLVVAETEVLRLRQQLGMDEGVAAESQTAPKAAQTNVGQERGQHKPAEGGDGEQIPTTRKRKKRKTEGDGADHAHRRQDVDEGGKGKRSLAGKKRKRQRQEKDGATPVQQQQNTEDASGEPPHAGKPSELPAARKKRKTRK